MYFVEEAGLAAAGANLREHKLLAGLPVVIDEEGVLRPINRYLRARRFGDWKSFGAEYAKPASTNTVKAAARDLQNFLSYCKFNKIDWHVIQHGSISDPRSVKGYAYALFTGDWSFKPGPDGKRGEPLDRKTVSRRAFVAQDFLIFAVAHGYRKASYDARPIAFGGQRRDKAPLMFPVDTAVNAWFLAAQKQLPRNAYLGIKMMDEIGLRRSEVRFFRASLIEELLKAHANITLGRTYSLEIGEFTKGGHFRTLQIPGATLLAIQAYMSSRHGRAGALEECRQFGAQAPDLLFFNSKTANAYDATYLYKCMQRVKPWPTGNWHPHLLRHRYACKRLLSFFQMQIRLGAGLRGDMVKPMFEAEMVRLQQELGHVSQETTEQYIQWVQPHVMELLT